MLVDKEYFEIFVVVGWKNTESVKWKTKQRELYWVDGINSFVSRDGLYFLMESMCNGGSVLVLYS